jgi:hypothetical protein
MHTGTNLGKGRARKERLSESQTIAQRHDRERERESQRNTERNRETQGIKTSDYTDQEIREG